jgi:Sec-independent protein secretion pathway component TatC
MLAVQFYDVVVALHVMSILIAFGAVFAYPVATSFLQRTQPQVLAGWHALQLRLGQRLITPAGTVALLLGAYLASDRDYWSEVWVTIPLVILIVILGLGGAYFAPRERRLSELAAEDPSSPKYTALARQVTLMQTLAGGLVLVAVFFMVTKLGA